MVKTDIIFIGHINSDNRAKLLIQTLDSFAKCTNFKLVNSVVFIDDCSPIELNFEASNIIYHRNNMQMGIGYSKNLGVELINNPVEFLYFSDSDVYFVPFWLETLLTTYLLDSHIGILGGGCHPFLQTNSILSTKNLSTYNTEVYLKDAVSGWSWLIKRNVWDLTGKLVDNARGSGQSEDWEYCQRIKEKEFLVGSIWPEVIFHTGITNTEGIPCLGSELFPRLDKVLYL